MCKWLSVLLIFGFMVLVTKADSSPNWSATVYVTKNTQLSLQAQIASGLSEREFRSLIAEHKELFVLLAKKKVQEIYIPYKKSLVVRFYGFHIYKKELDKQNKR